MSPDRRRAERRLGGAAAEAGSVPGAASEASGAGRRRRAGRAGPLQVGSLRDRLHQFPIETFSIRSRPVLGRVNPSPCGVPSVSSHDRGARSDPDRDRARSALGACLGGRAASGSAVAHLLALSTSAPGAARFGLDSARNRRYQAAPAAKKAPMIGDRMNAERATAWAWDWVGGAAD